MISANEGWAVGNNGVILHYINGAWQVVANPTSYSLAKIVMVSESEGWAAAGVILHYINGAWQVVKSPISPSFYSIAMVSPNEGWGFGAEGVILHYH